MNIWKEKREDKPNKEEQQEKTEYAIYKGDEFLFIGTKKECAKYLNVEPYTVYFYTTPTYRSRFKDNEVYQYYDSSNIAITYNSPYLCKKCYNKNYVRKTKAKGGI